MTAIPTTNKSEPKVKVLRRRAEGFTAERIKALKKASEVASSVHLKPERLLQYADDNVCPHYRIDGEAYFDELEVQTWVARALTHHIEGVPDLRVTVLHTPEKANPLGIPISLQFMTEKLRELPFRNAPAIYFLIARQQITYVGQSTQPAVRVNQHILSGKHFDRVLCLPCLESELDLMESVFIHTLRPPLNSQLETGEMVAPITLARLQNSPAMKELV